MGRWCRCPLSRPCSRPSSQLRDEDKGPAYAVVATADQERPELVLVTTREADQGLVNDRIRDGGLSALHSVRRVNRVETIPVLGTGKTDYRTLQASL